MSTDTKWDPRIAAERLAERHGGVLDYIGRVDQAVTNGDLFYLVEKAQCLVGATERLLTLANELLAENVALQPYLPLVEDYLVRAGQVGYRAAALLHPLKAVEPRGTLDHVAEITRGRVECLGGNVYGVIVGVATAHGVGELLITSNDDEDGYVLRACTDPAAHGDGGCSDQLFSAADDDEAIRAAVDEGMSWLARTPVATS